MDSSYDSSVLLILGACACVVVMGVILVMVLISRLGNRNRGVQPAQNPYQTPGPNRPHYDDPNVTSGGSFGGGPAVGRGPEQPRYNDPNVTSGGSFGGSGGVDRPSGGRPSGSGAGAGPGTGNGGGGIQWDDAPRTPPAAQGGAGGGSGNQPNRPTYDDPNTSSGGSFGG